MARVTVLGAGRVGSAMARDLAPRHQVLAVDRDPGNLEPLQRHGIRTAVADLTQADAILRVADGADLVIDAVPGFLGFRTLEVLVDAGQDVVDISFMAEDFLELAPLARRRGARVVCDMGVAPGTSNLLLGYHDRRMEVESFTCLVGGLPVERTWPYAYKAPFSPIDVLEEYTRPARFVVDGKPRIRPALSDVERVHVPGLGTLEAFNTDGLRSLLRTLPHIPTMREKTLRYPGHAAHMQALADAGFFSTTPIAFGEAEVRPIDMTAAILFRSWELQPGELELTTMRIDIEGREEGRPVRYRYTLLDRTDPDTGITSMARTTGYAATAMAELLLRGAWTEPGVWAPEQVGASNEVYEPFLAYLRARGVHYHRAEERP